MLSASELRGPRAWARADLRSRWRSLAALGLMAGLAAGLALAALAGARRTDSALARLRQHNNAPDAIVFPSQVGAFGPCPSPQPDQPCAHWDRFERLDYIQDSARWALVFGELEGEQEPVILFSPLDQGWLGRIEKPLVVEGRMFDADRHDEIVVDERLAETQNIRVGQELAFTPFSPDQDSESGAPATGPRTSIRVVGMVRTTNQFLFVPEGIAYLSPEFLDRYENKIQAFQNGVVRLHRGAADSERLKRDTSEVLADGATILDLNQVGRRVTTSTGVERTALLLLALAVAAAGVAFIGQALSRSAAVVTEDLEALRGTGFTRAQFAASAALSHVLSAVVALIVAGITAVALSTRFPFGLAGEIEPDKGFHFDALVLVPGLAAVPLLMVAGATALVWFRMRRGQAGAAEARSGVLAAIRRVLPLPIGLGTTMALVPGRGRSGLPVRPALLGAVVGIVGVIAAVTLRHGLVDALAHPERVGVTWDAEATPRFEDSNPQHNEKALRALAKKAAGQRDVGAAAILSRRVAPVGGAGVPLLAVGSVKGNLQLGLLDGRAPARNDEASIGPATARQLDVKIGDSVRVGERRTASADRGPDAVPERGARGIRRGALGHARGPGHGGRATCAGPLAFGSGRGNCARAIRTNRWPRC